MVRFVSKCFHSGNLALMKQLKRLETLDIIELNLMVEVDLLLLAMSDNFSLFQTNYKNEEARKMDTAYSELR